jgi:hypothetical protein
MSVLAEIIKQPDETREEAEDYEKEISEYHVLCIYV